eukprot:729108-Prymnesium_polylepis.1
MVRPPAGRTCGVARLRTDEKASGRGVVRRARSYQQRKGERAWIVSRVPPCQKREAEQAWVVSRVPPDNGGKASGRGS